MALRHRNSIPVLHHQFQFAIALPILPIDIGEIDGISPMHLGQQGISEKTMKVVEAHLQYFRLSVVPNQGDDIAFDEDIQQVLGIMGDQPQVPHFHELTKIYIRWTPCNLLYFLELKNNMHELTEFVGKNVCVLSSYCII